MGESRAYGEVLVVTGSSAFALAQLLRSQPVQQTIRDRRWLCTAEMVQLQRAVHAAACAWQEQRERSAALRSVPTLPPDDTLISVEQASNRLTLGRRQIQDLAKRGRLDSRKVSGRWQLSAASVAAYSETAGRA
jgi:hypothetical protein